MSANPRRERLAERLWWALMRSWPRRFTILFFVPLLATVLAYLLTPLYSTQTLHLEGLAFTLVFEGAVLVQVAALLAVLRRPPLVVTAVIVLTASAMLGVWGATMAMDGEAGLALAFPFLTGPIAAAVLGFLDVLLEHRDDNRPFIHEEHGR